MSTTTTHSHLSIPPADQQAHFGRRAFALTHTLADDERTSLEMLADLADALPADAVEHNVGRLPEYVPGGEVPQLDQTPGEIVRGIETNGAWIVLPLHKLPAGTLEPYRALFAELLAEMRAAVTRPEDVPHSAQAVFFLATGGSTTPAHIDPEQGYLLQVRGTKTVRIGPFESEAVRLAEIERVAAGGHRNVERLPEGVDEFTLTPGHGVHVPAFVPHVVRNGPETSLALSIGAVTRGTRAAHSIGWWNAHLRRAGLRPSAPGARPAVDRLKCGSRDLAGRLAARRAG